MNLIQQVRESKLCLVILTRKGNCEFSFKRAHDEWLLEQATSYYNSYAHLLP